MLLLISFLCVLPLPEFTHQNAVPWKVDLKDPERTHKLRLTILKSRVPASLLCVALEKSKPKQAGRKSVENQGGSDCFPETLENLAVLEILETSPAK